jgi:hypothetical protein
MADPNRTNMMDYGCVRVRESGKLSNIRADEKINAMCRRRPALNNRHHSWSYQCSLSIIPGLCFCSATNRNELSSLSSLTSECFTPRQENIRVSVWFWRQWRRPSSIPCFCGGGEREMEKKREFFSVANLKKRAGNRGEVVGVAGASPPTENQSQRSRILKSRSCTKERETAEVFF